MLGPSRRLHQDVAAALLDGKGIRHNGAGAASDGGGGTPQLSPSVVVIIVLITVVFFLSGFLHLLARCFTRPASNRNGPRRQNSSGPLAQGQLQDLFHLHDSGVEQAFIEALPVFYYRSVRGLKEGADCAVCLNEFSGDDRLRLLPKCSHAFHLECIDTWLLSHSTCPLCRCSLAPDSSSASGCGFGIRVESFGRSSVTSGGGSGAASFAADSVSSAAAERCVQEQQQQQSQPPPQPQEAGHEPRLMVPVKLGRFCPTATDPSTNSSSLSRRSYSMGSYDYVLDSSAGGDQAAVVVIAPTPIHRKWKPPGTPGHRSVLSECILEESGNGSPWMTIDVDSTKQQQQQPGHSLFSWVPWRSRASSGQGSSRSFSFRLPFQISTSSSSQQQQQQQQQQQDQEVDEERHIWWWKNPGGASRRSLCESVVPSEQFVPHQASATTNYGSSTCSQWDQGSVCSTNADLKSTGSAASSAGSIARRTLRWLMGRDRTPRVSVEDVAPSF